jgi:transcriptional regulator with XRE-family HTH domain
VSTEPEKLIDVGTNLRIRRIRSRRTQQELADAVGLSRNKISAYERGVQQLNYFDLVNLAEFYKINVVDLVEKDG